MSDEERDPGMQVYSGPSQRRQQSLQVGILEALSTIKWNAERAEQLIQDLMKERGAK